MQPKNSIYYAAQNHSFSRYLHRTLIAKNYLLALTSLCMRSTLKSMLSAQYGVGIQQKVSRLSRLSLKLASAKNQMIFLERCKNRSLIPTFLKNRCPVRSKHARCISKRYQCDLLKETLYQVRRDFHKLSSEIKNKISKTL